MNLVLYYLIVLIKNMSQQPSVLFNFADDSILKSVTIPQQKLIYIQIQVEI